MATKVRQIAPRSAQNWTLALASVASFIVVLDLLVVATALSTIRRALGASIEQLEWTVNAYTLTFAVLLMTAAALGDRFGRRRLFAVGLALFAAASAACALAPGVGWLIGARALQGAGAAMVMPLGLALLNAAFPPERRGWAMGIFGGVTGLAALVGPVAGGAITQGIAWQWIFWINVPIAVLAIPLVLLRVGESHGPSAALDIPGLGLGTGAALGLVWGLVRGNTAGWGSAEVVAALTSGAALAAAFVGWELRARAALLPMRLFRSRAFSAGNAVIFFLNAALTGAVFFMAQFQQTTLGQGPLDAGLRLLPWGITPFLIAPRAGALADRIGERPLIVAGLLSRLHKAQGAFYAGGDDGPLRAVLDPAVNWYVPGRNAIAGEYHGLDAVLGYMTARRNLARASFRLHPGELLVGGHDHVASLTDGSAVIDGTERRWSTVGLYRIRDGRIAECRLLPLDADEFDDIWRGPS